MSATYSEAYSWHSLNPVAIRLSQPVVYGLSYENLPIIIILHVNSFMELDILHINIRSSSEWFGGGKEQLGAIRLETITLDVTTVSPIIY